MVTLADYRAHIKQAKIYELTQRLQRQGYQVCTDAAPYTLTAERDGERVAYLVVVRPGLAEAGERAADLREQAMAEGRKFWLVFADQPRLTHTSIDGLDQALCEHIEQGPARQGRLPRVTLVDEVTCVEPADLRVTADGVDVSGTGTVGVYLSTPDGGTDYANWPFRFDVSLDRDLNLVEVRQLEIEPGKGWTDPQASAA
jgi:hypothetical protein